MDFKINAEIDPLCMAYELFSHHNQRVLKLLTRVILFFEKNFNVYLFSRQKVRVQVEEGQRERETQNLKQAPGSELSAQSPTRGSNPQTARS